MLIMNKDQKARKALEWDKKEVYEADAKRVVKQLKDKNKQVKKKTSHSKT